MVGKCANRIRAELVHSIRSSGTRRNLPSCWWRERRPALMQVTPCPNINSVRSIAGDIKRPSRRVVVFSWRYEFEIPDCRPSVRWRARRTTLKPFAHFVRIRDLRSHVTPRHRRSVFYGNTNYLPCLQSEFSRIGKYRIDGGEFSEPHQSGPLPKHWVIGHSPALAV
jgi:hypothetical protein